MGTREVPAFHIKLTASAPNSHRSTPSDGNPTLVSHLTLSFSNITYHVGKKQILHGVSGASNSGRVLALMGPSGAGKTSLLDILAGMPVVGKPGGVVLLNNEPFKQHAQVLSAYVQQADVLVPSATVREAILTGALLKLPRSWSRKQKVDRVDELLAQLELSHVASTFIGSETYGIKGISGGEKRRVSVGVELVKDPKIIFLDEPTTGLDSEMALGVMNMLQRLAQSGKMVVCTIHQPSSMIVDTFDDFMLLSTGRTMYSGSWAGALDYFEGAGHPCPRFKNPTDYFMSLVSDADIREQLASNYGLHEAAGGGLGGRLLAAGAAEAAASAAAVGSSGGNGVSLSIEEVKRSAASGGAKLWYQSWVLAARFWRAWIRTPIMVGAEASQYIICALFIGLLYLRSPLLLPNAPDDRLGALFLTLTMLAFVPSYTALVTWDMERLLLRREAASGTYSRGAFFWAKTLTTTPVEVVQVLVYATIIYFMIGFQLDAAKFLVWVAVLLLFTLLSETLGFICAIITPESKVGVALLSMLLVIILSFSGYLVRSVPIYFAWISKISYFSYATDALATNEFEGLWFQAPPSFLASPAAAGAAAAGALPDPATLPHGPDGGLLVPATALLPGAMRTGLSVGGNLGVLLAMTLGTRLMAWACLELAAKFHRL